MQEIDMTVQKKTVIVTGASQGIGAAVVNLFLDRGYNVLGNSRNIEKDNQLSRADNLAVVGGDIGQAATAARIVETAITRFGRIDALVHKNDPKEFLQTLSPLGQMAASRDIAEAVFYLTQASQVTGEVLHVDGGGAPRPMVSIGNTINLTGVDHVD
jgi:NAD(P)-dependent dehydrogenase (short-subunit alcohol dehydrogenase family)